MYWVSHLRLTQCAPTIIVSIFFSGELYCINQHGCELTQVESVIIAFVHLDFVLVNPVPVGAVAPTNSACQDQIECKRSKGGRRVSGARLLENATCHT